MATAGGGQVGPCAGCRRLLPCSAYSKRQWKRRDTSKRTCKLCVEKHAKERERAAKEKAERLGKFGTSHRAERNPMAQAAEMARTHETDAGSADVASRAAAALGGADVAEQRLKACIDVLNAVSGDPEIYFSKPLKPLRTALVRAFALQETRMFGGLGRDGAAARKRKLEKASEKANRRQQDRALDRQLINKRKLRNARLQKLEELKRAMEDEGLPAALPLIPDGSVDETADIASARGSSLSICASAPKKAKIDNDMATGVTVESVPDAKADTLRGKPRSCYLCKSRFRKMHEFYDQFCPKCADLNWKKRVQTADLRGRVAIVTGGRVKIGFRCALKLLRCGATVIATTRFPRDACRRFEAEKDSQSWMSRLQVVGLDFRDIQSVQRFCAKIVETCPRLDILINNACQTIRRPPAYYRHLIEAERARNSGTWATNGVLKLHSALLVSKRAAGKPPPRVKSIAGAINEEKGSDQPLNHERPVQSPLEATSLSSHSMSSKPTPNQRITSYEMTQLCVVPGDVEQSVAEEGKVYPKGKLDVNEQQIDLRKTNSWLLRLDQIDVGEAAEVMCINALAPFVLNSKLKPLMARTERLPDASRGADDDGLAILPKFIVNVSAMEGKFYRYARFLYIYHIQLLPDFD